MAMGHDCGLGNVPPLASRITGQDGLFHPSNGNLQAHLISYPGHGQAHPRYGWASPGPSLGIPSREVKIWVGLRSTSKHSQYEPAIKLSIAKGKARARIEAYAERIKFNICTNRRNKCDS